MNEFLLKLINNPELHAKWLNSLSYLEYRGPRKIFKSIPSFEITPDVLKHIIEETNHALHLKKMALAVGGEIFSNYNSDTMLNMIAIKKYFYDLDINISKHNKNNIYEIRPSVSLTLYVLKYCPLWSDSGHK